MSKIDQTLLCLISKMAEFLIRRYAQIPVGSGFRKVRRVTGAFFDQ